MAHTQGLDLPGVDGNCPTLLAIVTNVKLLTVVQLPYSVYKRCEEDPGDGRTHNFFSGPGLHEGQRVTISCYTDHRELTMDGEVQRADPHTSNKWFVQTLNCQV